MMQSDDSVERKWCPLCQEWKAATVTVAQSKDSELVQTNRELTYCPQCGAMLRDEPNEKPQTGGYLIRGLKSLLSRSTDCNIIGNSQAEIPVLSAVVFSALNLRV